MHCLYRPSVKKASPVVWTGSEVRRPERRNERRHGERRQDVGASKDPPARPGYPERDADPGNERFEDRDTERKQVRESGDRVERRPPGQRDQGVPVDLKGRSECGDERNREGGDQEPRARQAPGPHRVQDENDQRRQSEVSAAARDMGAQAERVGTAERVFRPRRERREHVRPPDLDVRHDRSGLEVEDEVVDEGRREQNRQPVADGDRRKEDRTGLARGNEPVRERQRDGERDRDEQANSVESVS